MNGQHKLCISAVDPNERSGLTPSNMLSEWGRRITENMATDPSQPCSRGIFGICVHPVDAELGEQPTMTLSANYILTSSDLLSGNCSAVSTAGLYSQTPSIERFPALASLLSLAGFGLYAAHRPPFVKPAVPLWPAPGLLSITIHPVVSLWLLRLGHPVYPIPPTGPGYVKNNGMVSPPLLPIRLYPGPGFGMYGLF